MTLSRLIFHEYEGDLRLEISYEILTLGYVMCSGEDVGLLKWKEIPPPPVTERDEPSNGAINQHRSDHSAFFSNTIDLEVQNAIMIYLDKRNSLQIKILVVSLNVLYFCLALVRFLNVSYHCA